VRPAHVAFGFALTLTPVFLAQDPAKVSVELSAAEVPEAYVTLHNLLSDDRYLRAMESGFPLHLQYSVELREARPLWDRTVARVEWEFVVLYDPVRERFAMEDSAGTAVVTNSSNLRRALGSVYEVGLEPDGEGEFYYRAVVSVRTLDDEDVDEVFAWLKGESVDSLRRRRPGLVTRTARRLLVRVAPLPRVTVEGRTGKFRYRG
jgi:hypothetical protein